MEHASGIARCVLRNRGMALERRDPPPPGREPFDDRATRESCPDHDGMPFFERERRGRLIAAHAPAWREVTDEHGPLPAESVDLAVFKAVLRQRTFDIARAAVGGEGSALACQPRESL